jgi:hypothetical protein
MRDKIEKWYKQGLWTKEMVRSAVRKNIILIADYEEITGQFY